MPTPDEIHAMFVEYEMGIVRTVPTVTSDNELELLPVEVFVMRAKANGLYSTAFLFALKKLDPTTIDRNVQEYRTQLSKATGLII